MGKSDKEGAELLFTNISLKTGRKSTIITTNLAFDRWNEILGDLVMTATLTDRLTHKSFVINMNGISYRLKETKAWLKTLT
ncbi:MAG: ATP-binding protein [Sarcina sp.]